MEDIFQSTLVNFFTLGELLERRLISHRIRNFIEGKVWDIECFFVGSPRSFKILSILQIKEIYYDERFISTDDFCEELKKLNFSNTLVNDFPLPADVRFYHVAHTSHTDVSVFNPFVIHVIIEEDFDFSTLHKGYKSVTVEWCLDETELKHLSQCETVYIDDSICVTDVGLNLLTSCKKLHARNANISNNVTLLLKELLIDVEYFAYFVHTELITLDLRNSTKKECTINTSLLTKCVNISLMDEIILEDNDLKNLVNCYCLRDLNCSKLTLDGIRYLKNCRKISYHNAKIDVLSALTYPIEVSASRSEIWTCMKNMYLYECIINDIIEFIRVMPCQSFKCITNGKKVYFDKKLNSYKYA